MIDITRVIGVAEAAADMALAMQTAGLHNVTGKKSDIDLVTEADVACEHFLRAELHDLLPSAGFWGEESNQQPDDGLFWLVDPIDGTVNYAHGLAYSAVNVALFDGEATILGVTVQMPFRRVYWARAGSGAFLRESDSSIRRLHVNQAAVLRRALLATGFPYHNGESSDSNDSEFSYFSPRCLALRVLGAAALDIAQVAAGMLAGFWEGWLHPWDAAAGALMVMEAGGRVSDYTGQRWRFGAPGFVASNGHIHDALLEGIHAARSQLVERKLPV